ncbi:MAG: iron-only hydrogenase system regulator [Ignavibacteriae bacterium]|nr:iron-only hydrogenase system regulator [Ignavibacteriota bacterium]NOG99913.1 iron-only hydrogenase system regulator [Ignavibacteriota bacterium]
MEPKLHTITISVSNREDAYDKVGMLLHQYADKIKLRVGYPIEQKGVSIIFIIIEITNDELGALSGKLGQINSVKVKSMTLKF